MQCLMAIIRIEKLRKEFKEVVAVNDLTLDFEDSKITCLLGPSGCGKTTLLRMIAGLEKMTSGNIYFNDIKINDLPPRKRNVGMVFQYPVVYRGIDVYHNIELPLLKEGLSSKERKKRIYDVAEMVGIENSLKKNINQLDNATKQFVAVAREIARQPEILLFDEPITNVDANSKLQFKHAFKELTKQLKQTIIYVTHDQTEAMSFADKIALMNDGKIIQYDSPRKLYNEPETTFGGWFLGNPGMNFITQPCQKEDGQFKIKSDQFARTVILKKRRNIKGKVKIGIRPEYIKVSNEKLPYGIKSEIKRKSITIGGQYLLTIQRGDIIVKAKIPHKKGLGLSKNIWVEFPLDRITVFDNGNRIKEKLQYRE